MQKKDTLAVGGGAQIGAGFRLCGFILLITTMVPALLVVRGISKEKARRMPMLFHRLLTMLLGFRVRLHGEMAQASQGEGPIFYVSNHSSYLDIPVLGSVIDGHFVAKAEVASWPLFGVLAKLQHTVFIERRASRTAEQRDVMRANLEQGHSLILFPEGTSSDGMRTLPFKSSLFAIVERPLGDGRFVRVQPVSILCTEINGMPIGRSWRPYYAWFGDMTLVGHLWDVFKISNFTVDIIFHPPVKIDDFASRKLLASHCEAKISDGVDQCVTGRFKKELAATA